MALDVVLLQGPRGALFLMSEVSLYNQHGRHACVPMCTEWSLTLGLESRALRSVLGVD